MAAASKPKKSKQTTDNVDLLKSEVASFASSLGLAPTPPSSSAAGFDDSDFRKSGPIKPRKTLTLKSSSRADSIDGKNSKKDADYKPTDGNDRKKKGSVAKPQPKPHPLQMDPFIIPSKSPNDKKIPPKLPLVKASLLSGHWYTDAAELESKVLGTEGAKASSLGIEELKGLAVKKKEIAERLMEQYTLDYETSRRRSGDMRLLETTARSGTSTDKVSAFTCLVEDNPIANVRSLDALLSMVTSKVGKRYAFTGFEALKELFIMRLLPDRKLKCLFQRPLVNLRETEDGFSLLLMWYWEECLKQRYERFVIALEEAIKDMLPNLKDRAMKTVYILLKSKSEQERRLLSALVNKLGDPERKVASTAGYHLQCLLSVHPNMKAVVIEEVDSFIFRPHIALRAKYQAVNFLSQILLSKKGDGPKIAKRLVDVYFALFKVLIKGGDNKFMHKNGTSAKNQSKRKKGDKEKATSHFKNSKEEYPLDSHIEMDSRLLSALLTGVNRAFPFVSTDEADDIVEEQTPILFRLVHSDNFNVGVQALMLLYQISSKNQIVSDRFYRSLYSKLLTPVALNFSKPEMFLGLLVKSMKNDISLKRVAAFSKRLLQVALQRPPQYACGCLFLLSEVLKAKPPLWTVVLQDESSDDDLEHFEDIIEDPESDIHPSTNSTKAANSVGPAASNNQEDDDSEFEKCVNKDLRSEIVSKDNGEQAPKIPVGPTLPAGYKPRHREPSYCNADRSSWWELKVLASHVHPSVSTMARTLLSGANIVYNGDPLNDLSLSAFLDKFMEKKPKPNKIADGKWHGGSQIAPARKLDMSHHLIGEEILQLAEEDVPAEDVVFHRFYTNRTRSSKKSKKKKKDLAEEMDEDALLPEGLSDEDDEEEIDNMLDDSSVPLDDDGNYDYDDLDRVAGEDDDDLLGGGSDRETDSLAEANVPELVTGSGSDEDGSFVMFGDDDGGDDDDSGEKTKKGKKRKVGGKLGGRTKKSPFASVEEYEHLINESVDSEKNPKLSKKRKVDSEKMPRSPKRKLDSEKKPKSKKKRNALL